MNTISNPLMNLHLPPANSAPRQPSKGPSMTSQQQASYQAAAMNDLARRHYAQTISRATNLSQLQLLSRYHQQQQQQLCCLPNQPTFALEPPMLSPIQQHQQKYATFNQHQHHQQQPVMVESLMSALERQAMLNKPLCRCRVMYLGSSVPHITKNGLHGIQEPLRHLYPDEQFNRGQQNGQQQQATIDISHLGADLGIDSWLSVWSNGLLLENVDEFGREIRRFFSIESLHYCAAVRYFDASSLIANDQPAIKEPEQAPEATSDPNNNNNNNNGQPEDELKVAPDSQQPAPPATQKSVVRFLPLDAPLFQCPGMVDTKHPPMFAAIMRRTSGIKVLECHAFICRRDAAANALVRCCTHAYADLLSARRMSSSSQLLEQSLAGQPFAGAGHLYRPPAGSQAGATKHLSLARRGRHLEGRQRRQPMDGSSIAANGHATAQANAIGKPSDLRANLGHSSSGHDTPSSSLCDGLREGTNSSGDDNYAIISRHQSRANSRGPIEAPAKRAETSRRVGARRTKGGGSSRSLFDDFMPASVGQSAPKTAAKCQTKLMSHSMDLLRLHDDDAANQTSADDLAPACCELPSGRTKRHSKSMQNLRDFSHHDRDQHQERDRHRGSFASSRASLVSGASVGSSGRPGNSRRQRVRHRQRLLARDQPSKRSLQEVLQTEVARSQPEGQQSKIGPDPMRGERANEHHPDISQQQQAIYERPNYYERIEGPKSSPAVGAAKKRDRLSCTLSAQPRRRQPITFDRQQQQQPMLYPPSLGRQFSAQMALAPIPPPVPLFGGHSTMQPLEAAYYAGALLKYPPPTGYCFGGPPAPPPPPGALLYGPDFHYPQRQLLAGAHYTSSPMLQHPPPPPTGNMAAALALATMGRTKGKQRLHQQQQQPPGTGAPNGKAGGLASRFRCLSPPVNFVSRQAAPQAAVCSGRREDAQTNGRPTSLTNGNGPDANELSVISGKPGFISHSSAMATASAASASTETTTTSAAPSAGGKRLSWIKRLSLSMSGSSPVSPGPQPSGDKAPSDRKEKRKPQQQQQQDQEKKRTSRLFVGSLTLGRPGRSNNKQQQQQTALVTSCPS